MSKLKVSANRKAQAGAYKLEGRFDKNKKRKLERHLKEFPNDTQASKALKGDNFTFRKAPRSVVPKYVTITKKTANGKTFQVKELARPRKIKASEYVNGIAVCVDNTSKNAMHLALESAKV
jgi:hypothetical protein